MYMKKMRVLLIIIVLALFIGCEKILEMDIEATAPMIVVNAAINPDSVITVSVTRSMHILDNSPVIRLTNANLEVYEEDNLLGSLQHWREGVFKGSFYPQTGKKYTIKVSSQDLPDAEASCVVPYPPISLGIDTLSIYDEYNNRTMQYTYRFKDKANERNYYHLFAMRRYKYYEYDPDSFSIDTIYQNQDTVIVDTTWGNEIPKMRFEPLWINSDDIIVSQNLWSDNGVIFTDELFDGQNYNLRLNSDSYFPGEDTITVYFYFKEITEELYKYYNSHEEHIYAKDDPFSEPVIVYSNVEGGVGIVGAFSQKVDSLRFYAPDYWGGSSWGEPIYYE